MSRMSPDSIKRIKSRKCRIFAAASLLFLLAGCAEIDIGEQDSLTSGSTDTSAPSTSSEVATESASLSESRETADSSTQATSETESAAETVSDSDTDSASQTHGGTASDSESASEVDSGSDSTSECSDDDPGACGKFCFMCTGSSTPVCLEGQCVECASTSDCQSGNWCDTSSHQCKPCGAEDDAHCGQACASCTAPTSYCHEGTCAPCAEDLHCETGKFCNDEGNCVVCATADHCSNQCLDCLSEGLTCASDASGCVACGPDAPCGEGAFCNAGNCEPCDDAAHCGPQCEVCVGATPECYGAQGGHCGECADKGDCPSYAWCDDGTCRACAGDDPEHCGTGCAVCEDQTPVCVDGVCVECADRSDCRSTQWCDGGACVDCGLTDPLHCGLSCSVCGVDKPYCVGGTCVSCQYDTNCDSGQWCNAGSCASCTVTAHCGPNCVQCGGATPQCGGATVGCVCNTTPLPRGSCGVGTYCNGTTCAACDTASRCGSSCVTCGGSTPDCNGSGCVCNATSCPSGQYCAANGLCAACNTSSKCGANCITCSGSTPDCNGTSCVCNATSCPTGQYCAANGLCAACNTSSKCGPACETCSSQTPDCNPATGCECNATSCGEGHYCTLGDCESCSLDTKCGRYCTNCATFGQVCLGDGVAATCVNCVDDFDCTVEGEYCDTSTHTCVSCGTEQACGPACEVCTGATPICAGRDTGCVCSPSPSPNGSCGSGSYCNASGACATCNTADKCGASCTTCSGSTPSCNGTACVCTGSSCPSGSYCNGSTCSVCDTASQCGPSCETCGGTTPICSGASGGCVCTTNPTDSCGGTTSWCNGSGACQACGSGSCGNGRCDCGETYISCSSDCSNPCPSGYTYNSSMNRCYKYVDAGAGVTWQQAQAACAGEGAHLADISSELENQVVSDVVSINKYFWFGLNDVPTTVSGDPTCTSPQSVDGTQGGTFVGTTSSGTNPNSDLCSGMIADQGKNEFFSLTPTVSGTWSFKAYQTTAASYDIAIYVDTDCTLGNGVQGTNFFCTVNNGSCYVDSLSVNLTAGTNYRVYLDSYNSYGSYALDIIPPNLTRAFRWDGGAAFVSGAYANWYSGEPDFNSAPTTTCTSTKSKYATVRCGLAWKGAAGSLAQWFIDECSIPQGYVCEKTP